MALVPLKFVDSIASSPTTRLDVNDGASYRALLDEWDFSPPPVTKALAESILTDGSPLSASAYENRIVRAKIEVIGTSADDLATKVRALMVELNRERNILKYQPGTTPLHFRTIRSPDVLVDDHLKARNIAFVSCPIDAEPFAYGLRVDASPVSVKSDATLTNGLYCDVTGVLGDVDTPALVKLDTGSAIANSYTVVATRRRGTPSSMPFALQGEAASLSTDTALLADGANASPGSGNNTAQTTFATSSTLVTRASWTIAAGADVRGTYRIFVRYRKTVSADVVTMRVNAVQTAGGVTTDTVTIPTLTGTSYTRADLGLIQFPVGQDTYTGYSGTQPNPDAITFSLQLGRTSGSGNIIVDEVLLVPADAELAIFGGTVGSSPVYLDGPNDTIYQTSAGGNIQSASFPRVGSLPMLTPNQTNRLFVIQPSLSASTESVNVTVSHWPRYLVV